MNQLKTVLLLGLLTGLFLFVGYATGGEEGLTLALGLAVVMNFASYWFSDKLVLSMYHAKELPRESRPELHSMLEELASKAGLPKPRLYLVDLPAPNAFATGRNAKHAVVAVSNSIVELLTRDELRAVLAHELSHVKNKDILVSSIAATLAGALSYIAQIAYRFGGSRNNRGNAVALLILLILTPIIATLIHLAVSRSREYLADESGAKVSGMPFALASALKKLDAYSKQHPIEAQPKQEATAHLFIVNPFKASSLAALFSTHPPMEERIKRLETMR